MNKNRFTFWQSKTRFRLKFYVEIKGDSEIVFRFFICSEVLLTFTMKTGLSNILFEALKSTWNIKE